MNSLLAVVLACGLVGAEAKDVYQVKTVEVPVADGPARTVSYRLLAPLEVEAGKQYPVILFLHGAGERGDDNAKQLAHFPVKTISDEWRKKYPCYIVAPQCPNGKRWVEVDWSAKQSTPFKEEPSYAMQGAIAALQATLKEYPIDRQRVYLTGLSMGGYGGWDLAERHPEWFAAVVPICGGGDERQAARLVGLPLWAYHGDADTAVPVERSRQMIEAIKAAGGSPKYSELPKVGHGSWGPAYAADSPVYDWLFAQQRPDPKTK